MTGCILEVTKNSFPVRWIATSICVAGGLPFTQASLAQGTSPPVTVTSAVAGGDMGQPCFVGFNTPILNGVGSNSGQAICEEGRGQISGLVTSTSTGAIWGGATWTHDRLSYSHARWSAHTTGSATFETHSACVVELSATWALNIATSDSAGGSGGLLAQLFGPVRWASVPQWGNSYPIAMSTSDYPPPDEHGNYHGSFGNSAQVVAYGGSGLYSVDWETGADLWLPDSFAYGDVRSQANVSVTFRRCLEVIRAPTISDAHPVGSATLTSFISSPQSAGPLRVQWRYLIEGSGTGWHDILAGRNGSLGADGASFTAASGTAPVIDVDFSSPGGIEAWTTVAFDCVAYNDCQPDADSGEAVNAMGGPAPTQIPRQTPPPASSPSPFPDVPPEDRTCESDDCDVRDVDLCPVEIVPRPVLGLQNRWVIWPLVNQPGIDEAHAVTVRFCAPVSDLSIRALNIGVRGARLKAFSASGLVLADLDYPTTAEPGQPPYTTFSVQASGVASIKLFDKFPQVPSPITAVWQSLTYTAPSSPVAIVSQPLNVTACDTASFTTVVSSGTTLSYRWLRDGVALIDGLGASGSTVSGSTNATLSLSGIGSSDAGIYTCVVSNSCGGLSTSPARLSVASADIGAQGGVLRHDGQLDNNDFVAFIGAFFSSDVNADVGVQGGLLGSDGNFDNNDFIAFIALFFRGCDQ